ncbi:hypothetical protein D9758_002445 [Tetrapyrgos nigripes]|uniref:DH domain-containing protein n=1 Tax=Tetrapyrgos nigripes TaxID=182062 RepID=A0A8H5LSW5_9AGAR|nr:hypothetical protein D9758_002445 [Tetrapyrgos nigripes]
MVLLARSVLSTPELSSPSGSVSSSDDSSFFSAVSSSHRNTSNDRPNSLIIAEPDICELPSINLHPPSKTNTNDSSVKSPLALDLKAFPKRRPSPLPLNDPLPSPISPRPRHVRKLRKSNPSIPRPQETCSMPSTPLMHFTIDHDISSIRRSLSIGPSRGLFRRQTTHVIPFRLKKRQRRSSLPTIPSATFFPLKRDDLVGRRIVKFQSPMDYQEHHLGRWQNQRSPYPTRSTRDRNTDALIALAWTGNLPLSPTAEPALHGRHSIPTMEVPLRSGWRTTTSRTTWSDSDHGDSSDIIVDLSSSDPLIVASPLGSATSLKQSWTLAMVITDEDISDEILMENLEKMRAGQEEWGWRKPPDLQDQNPLSADSPSPHEEPSEKSSEGVTSAEEEEEDETSENADRDVRPFPRSGEHAMSSSWQMARRALLICRELVRTERRYLAGLNNLTSNETLTPPPSLMLQYVLPLIQVSKELLQLMEVNPSAKGVADAFISKAERLEDAMVSWCGVVGSFFTGPEGKRKGDFGRSKDGMESHESNATGIKRRVGSWGKRINSIKYRSSSSDSDSTKSSSQRTRPNHKRKPSVRDLAIMPTQRVMRYTMLFRDLLVYTPSTSVSQTSVEQALEIALSLAQKCDRAQCNAAFLQ